jgi:hypothetical protein
MIFYTEPLDYILISCQVMGYFNSKSNVHNIEISVLGIYLGNYEADVAGEGLNIKIELLEAKGNLKVYKKTEREL